MPQRLTSLKGVYLPIVSAHGLNIPLKDVVDMIEAYPINLDPDYQRGHVWTDDQQARFMGHLLEGGTCPEIIVNEGEEKAGEFPMAEVVDGKQRLTAAVRWRKGEIPAILTPVYSNGSWVEREIWFDDLDEISKRRCSTVLSLRAVFVHLKREDVLRLYLKLNRGGTAHNEEEIRRVQELLAQEVSSGG